MALPQTLTPLNSDMVFFSAIAQRQKKVRETLSQDQILVLFSNPKEKSASLPNNGNFKADSNFYYLTGINYPDLIAVFTGQNYFIFAPNYAQSRYIWDSDLLGVREIKKLKTTENKYKIEDVFGLEDFEAKFIDLVQLSQANQLICQIKTKSNVFYNSIDETSIPKQLEQAIAKLNQTRKRTEPSRINNFLDAHHFFETIRLIKTPAEIELIATSASIAAKSHNTLAQNLKNITTEKELMSLFQYSSINLGSQGQAYSSIVASGENGCILHYSGNSAEIAPDDCVLIDAGCLYQGYCSDITRVFPKSGKFKGASRDLYQGVFELQTQLIQSLEKYKNWQELENLAASLISKLLIELKLIKTSLAEAMSQQLYKKFYLHSVGHFLGLDVHDNCAYQNSNGKYYDFQAGMVLTIEPGIYIHPSLKVADSFKGLAVRIEDDIVLEFKNKQSKELKPRVLSSDAIKEIAEIESLMKY